MRLKERSSISTSHQQWQLDAKHGLVPKALERKIGGKKPTSNGKENAKCQTKRQNP